MSINDKVEIVFGNKSFIDVTGETTALETFSLYEAESYGKYNTKIASNY